MNWFAQCRKDFVGHYARKHGFISRADLVEVFGISKAQASGDLQAFLEEFPAALEYDMRQKVYRWNREREEWLPSPAWVDLTKRI